MSCKGDNCSVKEEGEGFIYDVMGCCTSEA
jgi:hypothetical protein